MSRLPMLRPAEVVRALERAGFVRIRQSGSHLRLVRGTLKVTVSMHPGTIPRNTLRSILLQAGLTEDEFRALL